MPTARRAAPHRPQQEGDKDLRCPNSPPGATPERVKGLAMREVFDIDTLGRTAITDGSRVWATDDAQTERQHPY